MKTKCRIPKGLSQTSILYFYQNLRLLEFKKSHSCHTGVYLTQNIK